MQARGPLGATIDPAQAVAQHVEDAMGLPLAKRLPESPATAADEERHIGCRGNMPCALPPVACQCLDGARMQWQLTRLGELGLPYGQHRLLEIDVGIAQVSGLGDAQAS